MVSLAQKCFRQSGNNHVDARGRAGSENYFLAMLGAYEIFHMVADILVFLGRGFGESINSAMNRRVPHAVEFVHRVNNGLWLLRRRGVVEIREWLRASLLENWEFFLDGIDIHILSRAAFIFSASSFGNSLTNALRNPRTIKRFASARGSPRVAK